MSLHQTNKALPANSLFRYGYCTPGDIFNKAERERARLLESAGRFSKDEMCDHFFNFCVTAHALRDWTIKHRGRSYQAEVHDKCSAIPVLKCCSEVANSSKHFGLKEEKHSEAITSAVAVSRASYVDVYSNEAGQIIPLEVKESLAIDLIVEGLGHIEYVGFTGAVLREWEALFRQWGVPFRSIYL